MSLTPKPTATDVRAYREKYECGLCEAKAALTKQWKANQLRSLRDRCDRYMTLAPAVTLILRDLIELLESDQ